MPRNPEYQAYLDTQTQIGFHGDKVVVNDGIPANLETEALAQEIGWRKQQQVARAIHQARYEVLTPEMYSYLMDKTGDRYLGSHRKTQAKIFWEKLGYWPG